MRQTRRKLKSIQRRTAIPGGRFYTFPGRARHVACMGKLEKQTEFFDGANIFSTHISDFLPPSHKRVLSVHMNSAETAK
jgi:hypothetical protein